MPRTHNRTVVLIIERRRAKIYQVDLRTEQHPPELGAPRRQGTRRRDIPVISKRLVVMVEEQDVLRLEVRMNEVEVVEEGDAAQELAGKGLNVGAWEGHEAALFQEVEDGQA